MPAELRLPVAVWFLTTAVVLWWALQIESGIFAVGFYVALNGAALALGLARQPPLSRRFARLLAWCTAAQLPTMLTLIVDLEGNRNPKKQARRRTQPPSTPRDSESDPD